MLTRKIEEEKWQFIFAGANIDSFQTGEGYGIPTANITNMGNDGKAQKTVFKAVTKFQQKKAKTMFHAYREAEMDEEFTHHKKEGEKQEKKVQSDKEDNEK